MLQYRPDRGTCIHRMFGVTNDSSWLDNWLYGGPPSGLRAEQQARCFAPECPSRSTWRAGCTLSMPAERSLRLHTAPQTLLCLILA